MTKNDRQAVQGLRRAVRALTRRVAELEGRQSAPQGASRQNFTLHPRRVGRTLHRTVEEMIRAPWKFGGANLDHDRAGGGPLSAEETQREIAEPTPDPFMAMVDGLAAMGQQEVEVTHSMVQAYYDAYSEASTAGLLSAYECQRKGIAAAIKAMPRRVAASPALEASFGQAWSGDSLDRLLADMKLAYEAFERKPVPVDVYHAKMRQWLNRFQTQLTALDAARADTVRSLAESRETIDRLQAELDTLKGESRHPIFGSSNDGDAVFLNWVADRLVHVYGEDENVDFVHKLRSVADGIKRHVCRAFKPAREETEKKAARWDFVRKLPSFPSFIAPLVEDSPRTKSLKHAADESWIENDIDYAISQQNANDTPEKNP